MLLRIQEHEQAISTANQANGTLTSALTSAETRLVELYAEQNRMEEELAAKLEIIEKLRIQVKELEREKRDAIRRYNEQVCPALCPWDTRIPSPCSSPVDNDF